MGCGRGRSYLPFPFPIPPLDEPTEQRLSTRDILKMRLARGEITVEEYQEMLDVLQGRQKNSSQIQTKKSHIRMP